MRPNWINRFAAILLAILFLMCSHAAADRPNVLFIAVDDLRPQLGCYGHRQMVTPHLDRFASQGRLFMRHYVQVPTCGASRFALMTGRYPRSPQAVNNGAFGMLRGNEPPMTMPRWFREHGYATVSIGKISHQPSGRLRVKEGGGAGDGEPEMPGAWDEVGAPTGKWGDAWSAFFGYADRSGRQRGKSPPIESADVDDNGYPDGLIADSAVKKLAQLKRGDKPFFLAVGFYKPHLPFNAPRKYWDLYRREAIELAPHRTPPANVNPRISLHGSGEMFGNYGQHAQRGGAGKVIDDDYARHLRHAYFAAVSYGDAQIGKVLDAVDEQGLGGNTIIVVWGDHGWHLGDQTIWGKHTLYERSLRSALIVRTPGTQRTGAPTDGIVETIDLFPTLTSLSGLKQPDDLDGRSFAPLLKDPAAGDGDDMHAVGFWQSGRSHTLRTNRYRLIVHWDDVKEGTTRAAELYDHRVDPHEATNIAAEKPDLTDRLKGALRTILAERQIVR